ncbi:MotA/TolQ/ExbB proton channel family protein [Undibacterium sp. LX40W]|uniref:Biopolymer transport protein ExbB n=1 Tax=Undibacterium nitidum TaxID=2762298 RepID=A0A923HT35_9BURK|nr:MULTISPECIES: MotA/TolQ/ExbB proton channel family protein [Undibacterium]MBC3882052.1 MotA/TolQ/ExbB proton channel family protein [Undibacterium nitidum]MBC3892333.1 MotA/TolQ/ExbB proton channel family protein [Undibacterium sp. LX40W]
MPVSISQYWAQLDELGRAVAFVLILMSLVSWFTIFAKSWVFWRIRRSAPEIGRFWEAPTMEDALMILDVVDLENVYVPLAKRGAEAASAQNRVTTMMAKTDPSDVLTRVLRQELNRVTVRLESGLTLLASIGATAPFVGLLGTVWGIYHALTAVSGSTAIQIDLIAGPVGEALVMTGLGLLVAIPAVLAYNAFNRVNRITFAELDGFAFDLHAHLSKTA